MVINDCVRMSERWKNRDENIISEEEKERTEERGRERRE